MRWLASIGAAVVGYLRRRAAERSTLFCLFLVAVLIAVFLIDRQQVAALPSAALAAFIGALPDWLLKRHLAESVVTPAAGLVVSALSKEPTIMTSSVVASLESAALAAIKAVPLPEPEASAVAALFAAVETPSTGTVLTALIDILKVIETVRAEVPAGYVPGPVVVQPAPTA